MTDDIAALIEEAEHMLAILECRATEEMGGYDYVQPKIEKAKAALRAQAQENAQLHERLEDNHEFHLIDGKMVRVEVEPGSIPDGIECRNETIKLQNERIAELEKDVADAQEVTTLARQALEAMQEQYSALEAERERLLATLHGMQDGSLVRDQAAEIERLKEERDAIRPKTIKTIKTIKVTIPQKDFSLLADGYLEGFQNGALAMVDAIRALAQTDDASTSAQHKPETEK